MEPQGKHPGRLVEITSRSHGGVWTQPRGTAKGSEDFQRGIPSRVASKHYRDEVPHSVCLDVFEAADQGHVKLPPHRSRPTLFDTYFFWPNVLQLAAARVAFPGTWKRAKFRGVPRAGFVHRSPCTTVRVVYIIQPMCVCPLWRRPAFVRRLLRRRMHAVPRACVTDPRQRHAHNHSHSDEPDDAHRTDSRLLLATHSTVLRQLCLSQKPLPDDLGDLTEEDDVGCPYARPHAAAEIRRATLVRKTSLPGSELERER